MSHHYASMSVRELVEDVFPRALQAAQAIRSHVGDVGSDDASTAASATRDAYVSVAAAAVKVDRGQLTPVQGQRACMDAWATLGQVRDFLVDTALMEIGIVGAVFRAIVDNIAYAIKALATAVADALRTLFGGTPGDYAKWLLGGLLVLGAGWLYVAGFTAGGQSLLMSAGRAQLVVGHGVARSGVVFAGAAGHGLGAAAPEAVRLIPSLTGII